MIEFGNRFLSLLTIIVKENSEIAWVQASIFQEHDATYICIFVRSCIPIDVAVAVRTK